MNAIIWNIKLINVIHWNLTSTNRRKNNKFIFLYCWVIFCAESYVSIFESKLILLGNIIIRQEKREMLDLRELNSDVFLCIITELLMRINCFRKLFLTSFVMNNEHKSKNRKTNLSAKYRKIDRKKKNSVINNVNEYREARIVFYDSFCMKWACRSILNQIKGNKNAFVGIEMKFQFSINVDKQLTSSHFTNFSPSWSAFETSTVPNDTYVPVNRLPPPLERFRGLCWLAVNVCDDDGDDFVGVWCCGDCCSGFIDDAIVVIWLLLFPLSVFLFSYREFLIIMVLWSLFLLCFSRSSRFLSKMLLFVICFVDAKQILIQAKQQYKYHSYLWNWSFFSI